MMLNFLQKNLLKNALNFSLKSPQLFLWNQTHCFGTQIHEKRKESITHLFRIYGFTNTQISNLIKNKPILLSCNVDKTLKPKLDFFNSFGFSPNDVEMMLTRDPRVMHCSLENKIIPSCEFLKRLLKDNESVLTAIRRSTWVLTYDFRKNLSPNIDVLRGCGVPDERIRKMLRIQPRLLMQNKDRLKLFVEEIKGMGFEPVKAQFIMGLKLLDSLSKSTFKRKWEIYKRWGWSEDEIVLAFRRQPHFMSASEKKVERVMGFLVNEMGWESSKVALCPGVFMHSLEKWTGPRCLVVQFLLSKGVIKKGLGLSSFIPLMGDNFRERFVLKYSPEYPELITLYEKPVGDSRKFQAS